MWKFHWWWRVRQFLSKATHIQLWHPESGTKSGRQVWTQRHLCCQLSWYVNLMLRAALTLLVGCWHKEVSRGTYFGFWLRLPKLAWTEEMHACTLAQSQPFYGLFLGVPGWAGARRKIYFWTFMVQRKITEADTPTIQLGATASGLISCPPLSSPIFMPDALPATILPVYPALYRHQICWLSYLVAWLNQGNRKITRMWADAQRDGHPGEYMWCCLQKFTNSIPCTMVQSMADVRCWSAVQWCYEYRRTQDLDAKWISHLAKFCQGQEPTKVYI